MYTAELVVSNAQVMQGMFTHTANKSSPEEDNGFGHFVGIDEPTGAFDCKIGKGVIYQSSSCSVKTSASDGNSTKKIGTTLSTEHTSIVSDEITTKIKHNDSMVNKTGNRIDNSQSEMMQMMKSFFNDVLEGQKTINNKIEKLSQRVDKIDRMISSSRSNYHPPFSSPSVDTEYYNKANIKQASSNKTSSIPGGKENVKHSTNPENLIKEHLQSNLVFKAYSNEELDNLVKVFKFEFVKANSIIFKEETEAEQFFIIEEGAVDVFNNKGECVEVLKEPSSFAETALLNGSKYERHRVTVRARSDCKIWSLHRHDFRTISHTHKSKRIEGKTEFLRKIKISGKLLDELLNLSDIEDVAKSCLNDTFRMGEVIAREGEKTTAFYMIEEGTVNCYKKASGAQSLGTFTTGNSFGEKTVLNTTYIATSTVKCLHLLLKDFERIFQKSNVVVEEQNDVNTDDTPMNKIDASIDDFEVIRVLGTGNFSAVKLCKLKHCYYATRKVPAKDAKNQTIFALKCFKNKDEKGFNLNTMIKDEKSITSQLDSPFIVRFFGEIKRADKVYFILEAMLGGDLYKLLREKSKFPEEWIRFYAASVLCAFTEIHAKNIVYRDLKPENLIMTSQGYIKVIDFGLAKRLNNCKTYTCCGTLDYLSPEIILKTGHDMAVDYWALGILIYEMAAGVCPFIADDQIQTCQMILSGKLNIPAHFSPGLVQIVNAFLQKDPIKRLGKDNENTIAVKTHQWFQGFNWCSLTRKKLKAPYKPPIDEKIKDSASICVSSVDKLVDHQKDIIAKLTNADMFKNIKPTPSTESELSNDTGPSVLGKAKRLKASMFGGYY